MDARRAKILKIKEAYSSAWAAAVEGGEDKKFVESEKLCSSGSSAEVSECWSDASEGSGSSEGSSSSRESIEKLKAMYATVGRINKQERTTKFVETQQQLVSSVQSVNLQYLLQDPQWLL
eukprot:TRINITY_DN2159_c6_g1_i1.p1 TRINITY_DN2159_c6_g1~~TRINITY_DN2159_c6_g1_i1.p1  ORF type:complete len:120 (+),score=15.33 TRINITY_DN2159_c6_g1_i1:67-426(+)